MISVAVQGDSVQFSYVVGNWSECSVQCGHGGVQRRSVVCTLLGDGWALDVDQSNCDTSSAIQRPNDEQDCGYVDVCPHWTTAEWRQVHFTFFMTMFNSPEMVAMKRNAWCLGGVL